MSENTENTENAEAITMQWYVVHVYSGYEIKVQLALEARVNSLGKQDFFGEVLIPSETVLEMKRGVKTTSTRKFYPGYILVNMHMNDETWHIVKNVPKVTGFIGGTSRPTPIPPAEVAKITQQMEEGAQRPKPKFRFEKGDSVRVIDGPFNNFNGVVEEAREDKGKLKVMISVFGRATPVELDFIQVEKN
jgi:transcriptional antiterminator NusG